MEDGKCCAKEWGDGAWRGMAVRGGEIGTLEGEKLVPGEAVGAVSLEGEGTAWALDGDVGP